MAVKRSHADMAAKPPAPTVPATSQTAQQSPFMPMFETFRAELDAHHERRERCIKASRDITAASKKIIFTLQRIRELGRPPVAQNLGRQCTVLCDYSGPVSRRAGGFAGDQCVSVRKEHLGGLSGIY